MTPQTKQWLLIYLAPYLVLSAITLGAGFILIPLAGTLGVYTGLFSTNPYFTTQFKLLILLGCTISLVVFSYGFHRRSTLIGKIVNAAGAYLWCVVGFIGFGPQ
jgi:hypothetical protein